ncbi:MAG: hypothetical protein IPO04_00300 [Cytophagaceae bacterium]|nr:hypothetical protein [Cytophagaceae bacterium]
MDTKLLEKLDKMIEKGHIIEAFETFFSDDVLTHDEAGGKTHSKSEKRKMLDDFFLVFPLINDIKLHGNFAFGDTSISKFSFVFSNSEGVTQRWHELITRKWKDGKVVEEFYSGGDLDEEKKALKKENSKKISNKKVKEKKVKAEIKSEEKIPIESEPAKVENKILSYDNLRIIEGIGPKIVEVLKKSGITDFKSLASTSVEKLEDILKNEGPRYALQNPSTWPMQADLAAKGSFEELEKLKLKIVDGVLTA